MLLSCEVSCAKWSLSRVLVHSFADILMTVSAYSRHLVKYEEKTWPGQINLILLMNKDGIAYYHTYSKNTIDPTPL